jgi:hypothetical protein
MIESFNFNRSRTCSNRPMAGSDAPQALGYNSHVIARMFMSPNPAKPAAPSHFGVEFHLSTEKKELGDPADCFNRLPSGAKRIDL